MLPLATFAATAAMGVGKAIAGNVAETTAKASATKAAQAKPDHAVVAKARKTANEFESMFLESTMDRLTKSEGTDGPLGENGTGGGVYRSMLSKEYATQIVKSGGVGLADHVFREMMKLQGASHGVAG